MISKYLADMKTWAYPEITYKRPDFYAMQCDLWRD